MAEADAAPPQTRLASSASDVSARLQQVLALLFPSNLAAKAALLAVVVALLPLLPTSQAPRIWELPHLLLLGIIISYGVFGQRNADAEVAAAAAAAASKPLDDESAEAYVSQMMQGSLVFESNDRDGDDGDGDGAKDGGVQAWSSQYLPDDPLVVVADAGSTNGKGDASEKPLLLPVRKLKPPADESATLTGDISGGIEEEEEFLAPKATGYDGIREHHAIPSPSSVLDADLSLSPCSPPLLPPPPPPPPPPFLGGERSLQKAKARSFSEFGAGSMSGRMGLPSPSNRFRSKSAVKATGSTFAGYDPAVPIDDEADAGDEFDEMAAASDGSLISSDMATDGDDDNGKEESRYDDDSSGDEELFELATSPGLEAEAEDEVDRKADEFIAKFREQIRMQRVEPTRR
ncbi:hypothetical protein ACP70R_011208 [Stipagrostis hirtigluma subsp. patula]